jgi:hypothetical protein
MEFWSVGHDACEPECVVASPGPFGSTGGSERTGTSAGRTSVRRRSSRRIAASLCSLSSLSFQVFHSPIDGGDKFIVPLAFGPSLFRSQHVGELGQQVAFFLPNEHGVNVSSVSLPIAGRARPPVRRASRVGGKRWLTALVQKQKLRMVNRRNRLARRSHRPRHDS